MNFSWNAQHINLNQLSNTSNQLIAFDMRFNYKNFTEELCKIYYNYFDNNFIGLSNLFTNETICTFLDEELLGFNQLINRLNQYGIHKFTHHNININSQPVNDRALLVNVNGTISVNNSNLVNKFTETILLIRSDYDSKYYITNYIFRLIE